MKRFAPSFILVLSLLGGFFHASSANAMMGEALQMENLSQAEAKNVQSFANQEVRKDLATHFKDRLKAFMATANDPMDEPMSEETKAVLLKGIYIAISTYLPSPIDEYKFNQKMGRVLDYLRTTGVLPHAITVGFLGRASMFFGANAGVEFNFYIQGGQLKMTVSSLRGFQGGLAAMVDLEAYVGVCIGACVGDPKDGWYMGMDADAVAGLGGEFFAEVGFDVSSAYQTYKENGNSLSVKDLYQASTIYLGFGLDVGIGAGIELGLYRYHQVGPEHVLANPGQYVSPDFIRSKINLNRLH
jgi:hypothetical protein